MCIVFPARSLFPVYSKGKRTYQLFHILDNNNNLNSVHCLHLLFVYMYIVCFSYMFYVQRAAWQNGFHAKCITLLKYSINKIKINTSVPAYNINMPFVP